ncbi:hypothetical protein BFP70_13100 [Thioclava sp. SK-1]|uniref:DUF6456 domain-containing protein n=1 Tax=Thioclava sp. SK-1 TaxID=1889770 RepID=UPI000824A55C|nr:DUF6456 domain-containing protein [Thioclava sp. SK-1]OCX63140.1 hypothetical protein BFP70_13100 [Thioclava sp. SK-1]
MTTILTKEILPTWLPGHARLYVRHIDEGVSLRALARDEGCHPSTILRRIRRIEEQRDDPLVDQMLEKLRRPNAPKHSAGAMHRQGELGQGAQITITEARLQQEARRILRRLIEPGALMIVATDMDKAVILRGTVRIAVLERDVAQAFAVQDWISVKHTGRVVSYEITMAGRAALKRLVAAQTPEGTKKRFADQHRAFDKVSPQKPHGPRNNLYESPIGVLSRRRDKNGDPFLTPAMVTAGERLREDFELAQMGPRVTQNWDRFLTVGDRSGYNPNASLGGGSEHARERVAAALADLGPGLGDMALRCCCYLEGLEAAEKRLGWSARSGKIVLRIALQRLHRHYQEKYGGEHPLIG